MIKGKIKKTDEYLGWLKVHQPLGLICFEKGFHEVEPLENKKTIPAFDDNFNWFRCSVCRTITFTKKNG